MKYNSTVANKIEIRISTASYLSALYFLLQPFLVWHGLLTGISKKHTMYVQWTYIALSVWNTSWYQNYQLNDILKWICIERHCKHASDALPLPVVQHWSMLTSPQPARHKPTSENMPNFVTFWPTLQFKEDQEKIQVVTSLFTLKVHHV